MSEMTDLERKDEQSFADSVLAVALTANEEVFKQVKEDGDMCEAFRRLMEPEIKEALSAAKDEGLGWGVKKGREQEIFSSVQEGDYDVRRGAQKLDLSETEFVIRMKEAGYRLAELD